VRTHLEFRSTAFRPCAGEECEINPTRYGKRLAEFLAEELPRQGFKIADIGAEDWGWRVDLQHEAFPLWIGCGNYEEYEDGFLCFIEPSRPFVYRWFRRVPTSGIVGRLAISLEECIRKAEDARQLRWWTEAEERRG
jgi:hypothetical protein